MPADLSTERRARTGRALREEAREDAREALREIAAEAAEDALRELREERQQLEAAYDGDLAGILLGTPEQARAWRALRDEGDAEQFLRVFGDEVRNNRLPLPVDELVAIVRELDADRHDPDAYEAACQPRYGDGSDEDLAEHRTLDRLTIDELRDWGAAWVDAAYEVGEQVANRIRAEYALESTPESTPESQVLVGLDWGDRLLLLASSHRGYAAGDVRIHRRLEVIRLRLRRRARKSHEAMSG